MKIKKKKRKRKEDGIFLIETKKEIIAKRRRIFELNLGTVA